MIYTFKGGINVDEYLTTTVAQEKLHQAGKKAKNFKPIIDQAAAVEILNNWLESQLPPPPFPELF